MTPRVSLAVTQLSNSEFIFLLRDEFKRLWKGGEPIRVEELLRKWPQATVSEEGLLDLIYQEIVLREDTGEQPNIEEYRQRFPALQTPLQRQFAVHHMIKERALSGLDDPLSATITGIGDPLQPSVQPLEQGSKIHHYQLEGELGRGGMGIVFKARDEQLRRTVALKLLLGQGYVSQEQLHRFRAEAEILAQLQHPNIVQVFDVGDHEGTSFFAMEYVAGKTLQHKVRENPLEPMEAARLVHLLAQAMHAVHQRGIIHRDLKPSNVLLSNEQVPKITDFGLARQGQSEMTSPGAILGTPSYMAPEQASGQLDRVGPSADVYALGAILFELLTGRAPFLGASVPLTLHQVLHNDPPAPRRLQPGVPRDLDTICLKCLQKDPAKRFASAQELADDLQRFLRGEPIRARPIGWLENLVKWARREPKVARVVAFAIVVTLGAIAAVSYLWQAERHARQDVEKQKLAVQFALQKIEKENYFGLINTAGSQLAKGKFRLAAEPLAKCPEPLRDWEWYHLNFDRCRQGNFYVAQIVGMIGTPLGRPPFPADAALLHEPDRVDLPAGVISLATHPRQSSVVAGCRGPLGAIVIMDSNQATRSFPAHAGNVNWVLFAPDGNEFFSGGEDADIHCWNLATAKKVIKTNSDGAIVPWFGDHQRPISCMAFHPHEPWIASTTFDNPVTDPDAGAIFVWQRHTGARVYTLRNHTKTVTALAFHPNGKLLASASHDKTITLWDCQTGAVVRVLGEHHSPISCIAFSHDGSLLASSASPTIINNPGDEEIFVWNTEDGAVLHRMEGHYARIFTLAFAPGDKRLASAGKDRQVKLWDLQTGRDVLTLVGHQDWIPTLAFDHHGSLLSGSLDQTIRIWKTAK